MDDSDDVDDAYDMNDFDAMGETDSMNDTDNMEDGQWATVESFDTGSLTIDEMGLHRSVRSAYLRGVVDPNPIVI
ncbi:hypothetical protein E4U17_001903 [Claviceps sp. LM77 group G4]|nr:hypothetical protein E4U17_001903 [Claviceps sp. LM77 group G4]KAG6079468.1 hypothetical protein E4U16_001040 [Claviceps sp. LM84 group G4]